MDELVEKALLFDFYGELLTENQKEVYGEHIQNDFSVTEIANLRGISRQGAYDMIRRCEKILSEYEDRLHLVEHFTAIKTMVQDIKREAEDISSCEDIGSAKTRIEKIKRISDDILEQF